MTLWNQQSMFKQAFPLILIFTIVLRIIDLCVLIISLFLRKWTVYFLNPHPQINGFLFNFVLQILAASTENRYESHRSFGRTAARPLACATGKETFAFLWGGSFHSRRATWGSDSFVLDCRCVCVCMEWYVQDNVAWKKSGYRRVSTWFYLLKFDLQYVFLCIKSLLEGCSLKC